MRAGVLRDENANHQSDRYAYKASHRDDDQCANDRVLHTAAGFTQGLRRVREEVQVQVPHALEEDVEQHVEEDSAGGDRTRCAGTEHDFISYLALGVGIHHYSRILPGTLTNLSTSTLA